DTVTGTWSHPPHTPLDAVLIRPDGYTAWTSPGTTHHLTHALTHWFGTPTAPRTAVSAAAGGAGRAGV
uniref:aromatic-ring hydroxylase C-terminal domain-containing protein n=1 Tax=Streptomyces sp. CA2R106 TaxID=3120153 RepID=UPI003FA6A30B